MLDVCLLGTGGMMPLPYRWLTSLLVRYNGSSLLIDCGEGTQIAIKEKGWSFKPIDVICFTHYHGDHIYSPITALLESMDCLTCPRIFSKYTSLPPNPAVPNRKIFLFFSFANNSNVLVSALPLSVQNPIYNKSDGGIFESFSPK